MLLTSVVSASMLFRNTVRANWKYDASPARESYVIDELNKKNGSFKNKIKKSKYNEMVESPFKFFRGTNHLYWMDIGQHPDLIKYGSLDDPKSSKSKSTRTWLCGDAHINNMGTFSNNEGKVVYDINDFDESLIADYQYDVWRMAISIVLVLKSNQFTEKDQRAAIDKFSESYLDAMKEFVGKGDEHKKATLFSQQTTGHQLQTFIQNVIGNGKETERRRKLLEKYTVSTSNSARDFLYKKGKIEEIEKENKDDLKAKIQDRINSLYGTKKFNIKDIALRLGAGIGGQGAKRYYALIPGASNTIDDYIILDIKEQSTPSAYLNVDDISKNFTDAVSDSNPGKRVFIATTSLGQKVDNFFGYIKVENNTFTVREKNIYDETFNADGSDKDFKENKIINLDQALNHFDQIAKILAAAHARADVDASNSGIQYKIENNITEKVEKDIKGFKGLVWEIASNYAKQVEFDYKVFKDAYNPEGDPIILKSKL